MFIFGLNPQCWFPLNLGAILKSLILIDVSQQRLRMGI